MYKILLNISMKYSANPEIFCQSWHILPKIISSAEGLAFCRGFFLGRRSDILFGRRFLFCRSEKSDLRLNTGPGPCQRWAKRRARGGEKWARRPRDPTSRSLRLMSRFGKMREPCWRLLLLKTRGAIQFSPQKLARKLSRNSLIVQTPIFWIFTCGKASRRSISQLSYPPSPSSVCQIMTRRSNMPMVAPGVPSKVQ